MNKKILIGVTWPYVNGNIHVGHLAGYSLPADVFARFKRLKGDDVLMVSGSDCHGTPITVQADKEKLTPQEIVEKYHQRDVALFKQYNISYNLYTKTTTENHKRVVQQVFLDLLKNNYIIKGKMKQYYSSEDRKFLPDRYVEGTCPHCGAIEQRSDQCENCGRWLGEGELIDPISKQTGARVELKSTQHYFLNFENQHIQDFLRGYLPSRQNVWRDWVYKEAKGWLDEGLHKRAITRDLDWGIELPVEGIKKLAEETGNDILLDTFDGKRIYVWFEAVTGYLSAPQEWSELKGEKKDMIFKRFQGQSNDWTDWWVQKDNVEAEQYYFMGQDNLVFHTLMWPSQVWGADRDYVLPHNVVVNKFMNFNNAKFSKSRENVVESKEIAEEFGTDAVRYFILSNLPENKESNFIWDRFIDSVNNELVANLGNFINRTLVFYNKNFKGGIEGKVDTQVMEATMKAFETCASKLEACEFVSGLNAVKELSGFGNKYFNDSKLWEVTKTDPKKAKDIMLNLLNIMEALRLLIRPFFPEAFERLSDMLGVEVEEVSVNKDLWKFEPISGYLNLKEVKPLFAKIDKVKVLEVKESKEKIDPEKLFEPVKLVKITETNPHPNADKLLLVKFTDGAQEFEVVTGASNIEVGDYVAYLGVGGMVPGAFLLKGEKFILEEKDLRGIISKGMILSEDEIGIGSDHSGIYIFEPSEPKLGQSIYDLIKDKLNV